MSTGLMCRVLVRLTVVAKRERKPMILPAQDPLISMHMASSYRDCLGMVKASLKRESCEILAEVPFHREIEREIGLHLRRYTVLVVWDPFQTYQGLLSERGAGLFLPFHFLVADIGGSTLVAALNLDFIARSASTLGVQLLLRNLEHKIRSVFSELYRQDKSACAQLIPTGNRHDSASAVVKD